jgi:hypothetical protein
MNREKEERMGDREGRWQGKGQGSINNHNSKKYTNNTYLLNE